MFICTSQLKLRKLGCLAQRKNKYYRAEDFDGAVFKSELQEWRGKCVCFMPSFVQCTFIYINNDHILTKNLPRAGKTQNTVSFGAQSLDVPKMRKSCEKDKCFSFHGNNLFNGVLSSGKGPVQPHRREEKSRTNLKRSLWKCVDDCFSLRKRVY